LQNVSNFNKAKQQEVRDRRIVKIFEDKGEW
jgi:anaerobic ribonucleoside-triphosphate reductase